MKKEEAIKQLKDNRVLCINSETEPFAIAYDMAIKALEQTMIIELTDEELIKLEELTGVDIKNRDDAEFAISVVLENA